MAWRPNENLIDGELDNRKPGRVTGWLRFVGLAERVTLDLEGDFHRDIRGTLIRLSNPRPTERGQNYMDGFCPLQKGKAGDITAGRPPCDYADYPYIEWYADNGRVVLELEPSQLEVVGTPRSWQTEKPVSRAEQRGHLQEWLSSLAAGLSDATANEAEEG